jgi:hypothetical protein
MTRAAFVTVNTCGEPEGHETPESAVAKHLHNIGGAWNLFGHEQPRTEADLAGKRMALFEYVRPDCSPLFAAIFDNRADGQSLDNYRNRHLWGRANSESYVQKAESAWKERTGPRVGDYVRHPDGKLTRFTYDWGDGLQAGGGRGSYHLTRCGFASYSGGLSAGIPRDRLTRTGETMPGEFWFFLDGWTGAHRGVSISIPCRVYQEGGAA